MKQTPPGLKLLQLLPGDQGTVLKSSVLVLTFISYTCYHASRKPLSVVKAVFNESCDELLPPPNVFINDSNKDTWCHWKPLDGPESATLLGILDSSFLFAYAVAMFVSGFIAERMSLRYFLSVGMILSGISCYLFGIAHTYNIHFLWYYIAVQIFGGIVQTTGWPGVVAVMGNWYGKSKRGLIFGLWNSHTSLGNILGALVASYYLETDWGFSFIVPGLMIAGAGFLNFLFLVESPTDVGLSPACQNEGQTSSVSINEEPPDIVEDSADSDTELLDGHARLYNVPGENQLDAREQKAVGFWGALQIPGVVEFSLCLFFAKLVSYTFLYWLPLYINSAGTHAHLSPTISSDISTIFDVGGILGGIIAGVISDYSEMSATTCAVMLILSIPLMFLYNLYGAVSLGLNLSLLVLVGFFVNGPYALITTAVSAELGCHKSLSKNSKALATVTAVIDGTGSIGAAVGPLLAGIVSNTGWQNVFYLLMASNVIALLILLRLVRNELVRLNI